MLTGHLVCTDVRYCGTSVRPGLVAAQPATASSPAEKTHPSSGLVMLPRAARPSCTPRQSSDMMPGLMDPLLRRSNVLHPSIEPKRVLGDRDEAVMDVEAGCGVVEGVHHDEAGSSRFSGGHSLAQRLGEE